MLIIPDDPGSSQPSHVVPPIRHESTIPRRVEYICEGGTGGRATVFLVLTNTFPGPGGLVVTEQDIAVACRLTGATKYSTEFQNDASPE